MPDASQFSVDVERLEGDVAVVVLSGEIDLYTAPRLHEVLLQGIAEGAHQVVVDLSAAGYGKVLGSADIGGGRGTSGCDGLR